MRVTFLRSPLFHQIHLSEGLINEAEKLLCSLVCWFTDRQIRMRFIEGCLENLAHHRHVCIYESAYVCVNNVALK